SPLAQAAPAEALAPAKPAGEMEAEGALADLAVANAEPAEALEEKAKLEAAGRAETKDVQPARYIEAKVKGDLDNYQPSRPEQPKAARPVAASATNKDAEAGVDAPAPNDGAAAWAAPRLG